MKNKSFSSKVLLFGEYSVIKSSMALTIPFPLFEGSLRFSSNPHNVKQSESRSELKAFWGHLNELGKSDGRFSHIDCTSFGFDIDQGLFFDSTIPAGFGVGSSGSLVAAVYERYCKDKTENILELKDLFSKLEGHFHAKSSGLDPLVSYLDKPILVKSKNEVEVVSIPEFKSGKSALFLINTGRERRTEPLVNLFLEKCKQEEFNHLCSTELNPVTNECIESFLAGSFDDLWKAFKKLSLFQYEHFKPMIPKLYHRLWTEGLSDGRYCFKLCGAGGGGFLLGMTTDLEHTLKTLDGQSLRILYRF